MSEYWTTPGSLFLHLQLILAFITSKLIFPYKVYKSYTELGQPVVRREDLLAVLPTGFGETLIS